MIFKKLMNRKKAAVLTLAALMLMPVQAYANVIIQPGVVLNNDKDAPVSESTAEDSSGVAIVRNGEVVQQDAISETAASDTGDTAGAPAESSASESAPGTGDDSTKTPPIDYAAQSLEQKNTIVSTNEINIVYINGHRIDLSKPLIALTYDDGPQTSVGNRIMDIMAQYGQKCTFFMVGDRVPSRAAEVQRMVAEGHEVANHTYGHVYLNKVGADTIRSQVDKCNTVIAQTTGVTPVIMRLPGGNKNSTVLSNVNMPIILWNIDTRDWATRNAESTKAAVIGKVKSGDIVLMHELYESTATATASIVPTLVEQGFQLVTVSELAALKGVELKPNTVYYSF